jgi:glycosyltransferase involved in cell wall biosynthesis
MLIDIIVLTKNSNKPWFRRVLQSISNNCPIHHLILVDGYSSDGTIETVKKFFPEVKIIRSRAKLGQARKIGALFVDTSWFAYVDSDIELCRNWFQKLAKYIEPKVGAIQSGYYNPFASYLSFETNLRRIKRRKDLTLWDIMRNGLLDQVRGLTTSTLIRKELLDDWNPDANLSSCEDYTLSQHIVNKGYEWLVINDLKSIHWKPLTYSSVFKENLWQGAGVRYTKAKTALEMIIFTPAYIIKTVLFTKATRDSRNLLMELFLQLGYFIGYFCYKKYYFL